MVGGETLLITLITGILYIYIYIYIDSLIAYSVKLNQVSLL